MKKKVKRYNEGGKTEEQYKKEGLEASKGDKVGFFERLRMGNIDAPGSEAYQRFGAGRGRMEEESRKPVPESAKETSDYSGRGAKSPDPDRHSGLGMAGSDRGGDDEMNVPHSGTPSRTTISATTKKDSSDVGTSYMPKSTFKQQEMGDATNDNIKVKPASAPKKSVAPKKTEPPKTRGVGMAGADTGSKKQVAKDYSDIPLRAVGKAIEGTASNLFRSIDPEAIRKERLRTIEERRKREKAERLGYGMKKGGKVSSASSRADGIAQRGKTRGKLF